MITEPKSTQKNAKELHSFIVFNHLLSSYTSTLFTTIEKNKNDLNGEPIKLLRQLLNHLSQIIQQYNDVDLNNKFAERDFKISKIALTDGDTSQEKKLIIEQLIYLKNILSNIDRIQKRM